MEKLGHILARILLECTLHAFANCICICTHLQIVSAFCLSISFAPMTHFLLKFANQKLQHCILAHIIMHSGSCTLQSQLNKNQRLRKNSQCPNVRFASWLYLYRALDCNYLTKCMRRKKYLEFNIVLRKKCLRHLLPSPLRPAAYSISIWCNHWTPTHRVHKCTQRARALVDHKHKHCTALHCTTSVYTLVHTRNGGGDRPLPRLQSSSEQSKLVC